MKKLLLVALTSALSLSTVAPSFANDSLDGVASLAGSVTATVIDTPQATVVDSLWWSPKRSQRYLAGAFGDDHGFQQNVVAAMIGIPWGVVWGIPTGALRGAKHGMGTGWEKPFSTESFVCVSNEDDGK